ncbi:MAG: InlB B-repeat-containing protein, partial [Bacteroidales bacterium]|nr:InlB B-repeat-containing protein [Bacteroidales bacterium]
TFVNWTKNGTQVSTSASYSFTVTETASYVANFQVNGYQITASANPSNGGTVSGSGTYNHGDNCTLTATAGTGYTFVNWTKNGTQVSTSASYNFTVTADADFVAHFTQSTFEIIVSASPTEGGTVYGGGAYLYEESCTVIAVANVGYSFNNWTKNGSVVSTDANYTFNVLEDANLVAHFSQDHYNITVSADSEEGGAANGGGSFTYGETCTLTATANIGYTFVNWTKNGTQVSTNASYSFTVTGNASYVAHFTIARYMVTVGAEPAEGGIVHGSGTHNYGSIVTLWAVANEGYVFENWTRDGHVISTNAIHAVRVTEDVEYIAHFRINVFEIKAKTEPENTGDIEGVGFYEYGEICTLTVTPHDGYEFVNWTLEDGEVVSQNPSFSFEVTEERYYIAHLQSVEDVGEQSCNKVDLYPNPAKNKLTIEASEPVNILEVYNINGVLVHKLVNCSERIELNVGTYAIGAYMIRLTMVSTVEIRRFVKE